MIQFLFNEDLFLKIKGSKILLDQGDQLLIGLIKILQVSNGQGHLIVQIRVVIDYLSSLFNFLLQIDDNRYGDDHNRGASTGDQCPIMSSPTNSSPSETLSSPGTSNLSSTSNCLPLLRWICHWHSLIKYRRIFFYDWSPFLLQFEDLSKLSSTEFADLSKPVYLLSPHWSFFPSMDFALCPCLSSFKVKKHHEFLESTLCILKRFTSSQSALWHVKRFRSSLKKWFLFIRIYLFFSFFHRMFIVWHLHLVIYTDPNSWYFIHRIFARGCSINKFSDDLSLKIVMRDRHQQFFRFLSIYFLDFLFFSNS